MILVVLVINASMSVVFANEGFIRISEAEKSVDAIENVVTTTDAVDCISRNEESYFVNLDGINVSIPKNGDSSIEMDINAKTQISMRLPSEVSASAGILTENGTVVYHDEKEKFDMVLCQDLVQVKMRFSSS